MSKEEEKGCYLTKAFWALIYLSIVLYFFPWAIEPFTLNSLWETTGSIEDWIIAAWPVLAWASGVNLLLYLQGFVKGNHKTIAGRERLDNSEKFLIQGSFRSACAGIFEEISFRWVLFLNFIVSLKIGNFLFFGFLGFGIGEFLHLNLFGPLANWVSFGFLEGFIFHPAHWAIGAAILASNALFRDGHKYQGLFGFINSWFIGLYFFWIMFNFGLPAAIFIHFLYDILIDVTVYLCQNIMRLDNIIRG